MTTREATQLLQDYTAGGSEEAFRRLVEEHEVLVRETARRQLNGDIALAKDVAQTVFAAMAANPAGVRGPSVAAWLHRVTVRRAADAVRGEVRRRHREQAALICPDSEAVMPEHDDFWDAAAPAIDAALDRLPAEDRAILIERFWQRQNLRAIGDARGLSGNAVQKRITRSLERLRDELRRRGIRGSGSLLSVTLGAALVHSGAGSATASPATGSLLTHTLAMTAKQKIITGTAVFVLLGLPAYQQVRIHALEKELAARPAPAAGKTQRSVAPVVASTVDSERSPARRQPLTKDKKETTPSPVGGNREVVAKVSLPGPGEATFIRNGDSIILDSFRADPYAGTAEDGAAIENKPASGLTGPKQWDHSQATGAPDTRAAGDRPTAWAPKSPKSGEQWLELGYDKAVEVKEINIHESYNSGAISRVTAFLPDGSEKTLWTGHSTPSASGEIQETSVPVPPGITSREIKVYVDTNRVESWPEIDAVELVGTNGSRQWASKSSASSSYSDTFTEGVLELETTTRNLGNRSDNNLRLEGRLPRKSPAAKP